MNKSFIVTFSISIIVFATAVVVSLMLLLPKQLVSLKTSVESYKSVEKSNYTYTKTKNISKEALLKEYKITNDDITSFKNSRKYVAGNSDPFYRQTTSNDSNDNKDKNTSTGSNSNGASAAIDKTTNSNGGIPNPPSTSK